MELEIVSAEKFGIEEVKAKQIREQFEPMLKQMEVLEVEANKVFHMKKGNPEAEEKAKEVRLKLVKVRTGTALIHKQQKDFYLKAGRFIDGWKNAQIFAGQGLEERLLEIENFTKIKMAEKIEALNKNRSKQIEKYLDLESNELNFGAMHEDVWVAYLEKKENQYLELIEAEKEAENKRKEDSRKIQVGHERFVRVLKYVNYLADSITSYDFTEMTEENYDNLLLSLILAEKEEQELNRRKALILPYSRFISDKEFVLQLDLEGFNQCVTSLVSKDLEEKQIKAKREERGEKLSAILSFVDNYEALINSTDDEFQKGLAEAQARADKRTDELRVQATKENQERAERVRLQAIENDRNEKAAKEAKDAEKLAKAPVKKQLQVWIEAMNLESPPVQNELSIEILKKFEGFKKWAKGEIEKL